MAKKKIEKLRDPKGRFKGVYGMTPAEVAAWREQEISERKKEAKAKDEHLRKTGRKPGRPRGEKRLAREAEREARRDEIKRQQGERKGRASRGRGYQLPKADRRTEAGKQFAPLKSKRGGNIEKTVYRFLGAGQWPMALGTLRKLPSGTSAWVQIGTGYGPRGRWVGSRLTSPAEASHWLQGIGMQYRQKMFPDRKVDSLWTEVITYRKVKNESGTKAKSKSRGATSRAKENPRRSAARKSGGVRKGAPARSGNRRTKKRT